jgi:hypothetical protein
MLNSKRRAVVFAVITHTSCSHAAFDQFGMSTYINDADFSFLAGNELPALEFVYWSALGLDAERSAILMPAQDDGADKPGLSVSASPVPVPSALWFFGSALVALTVIQRRA